MRKIFINSLLSLLFLASCSASNEVDPQAVVSDALLGKKTVTRSSLIIDIEKRNSEIIKKHGILVIPPDMIYNVPIRKNGNENEELKVNPIKKNLVAPPTNKNVLNAPI